ncbi:hypothetical protein FB451DRAFT_1371263 [Mycena latifolia]|nr:hypothetical protein FB451DRAFT_1371263 [Mycena latifolia]
MCGMTNKVATSVFSALFLARQDDRSSTKGHRTGSGSIFPARENLRKKGTRQSPKNTIDGRRKIFQKYKDQVIYYNFAGTQWCRPASGVKPPLDEIIGAAETLFASDQLPRGTHRSQDDGGLVFVDFFYYFDCSRDRSNGPLARPETRAIMTGPSTRRKSKASALATSLKRRLPRTQNQKFTFDYRTLKKVRRAVGCISSVRAGNLG